MDDPNITMEEYIRLEEEKAQKRGKVFNWETAKYAFNDEVSSKALSCEPTVSSLNNEIDFRISFDDSDDEDYTVIFEKNSFSYKKNSTNDLKTDSENDNEKVMPSLPSPEPAISCFNDLDFFKDFENEFPAIVYNDALTSKSDLLTEPILNPQHVDEFDLKNETSLSKYDEEEQNVLYFNDLFPFNVIHPNDLKSDEDNDDNEIDIIQSSEDMAPLPPREQRHPFLRYHGLEYSDADVADFEERLERIYSREIHKVHVVDFQGMPELIRDGLFARMVMEHRDDAGIVLFTSQVWGRPFDTRGPLVRELILEFLSTLRFGEILLDLDAPGTIQFYSGLGITYRGIYIDGDFLGPSPSYTLIRDPVLRLCHRMMTHSIAGRSQAPEKVTVTDLFYLRGLDVGSFNIPYLLARYLRRLAVGRKSGAHISGGQFVAMRLERQHDAMAGAPAVAKDAPAVDEGDHAVLAPVQALQQPPPPPPATTRTMPQRLGRLKEEVQGLRRDVRTLRGLMERLMTDQGRFSTWMISCMAQLMDASVLTYQAFDGTF
ncbi:hypothetical protein Tco_1503623 [Tanacetum coccineum]